MLIVSIFHGGKYSFFSNKLILFSFLLYQHQNYSQLHPFYKNLSFGLILERTRIYFKNMMS